MARGALGGWDGWGVRKQRRKETGYQDVRDLAKSWEFFKIENIKFKIENLTESDISAILEVYRQCEDFLALGPSAQATPQMVLADLAHSKELGGVFCGIYVFENRESRVESGDWESGDQELGNLQSEIQYPKSEILAGVLDTHQPAQGEVFIELLMIAAPWRGQGLGEVVVRGLFAQFGARTIFRTAVQVNNPRAVRFWQRLGFRSSGPPTPQPDGTVTWEMERSN